MKRKLLTTMVRGTARQYKYPDVERFESVDAWVSNMHNTAPSMSVKYQSHTRDVQRRDEMSHGRKAERLSR
jgi:hypothetical protein